MSNKTISVPIDEIGIDANSIPDVWNTTDEDEDQQFDKPFIGALSDNASNKTNLWYKTFDTDGQQICFKLATGSESNLIPKHMLTA